MFKLFFFIQIFIFSLSLFGQEITADKMISNPPAKDSIGQKPKPVHSPKTASLMSAILPGLGQAYNKKYWKIPLVYAAIGTSLYLGIQNNNEYRTFRDIYKERLNENPHYGVTNPDSAQYLLENRDLLRKNRDLSFIITGLFYVLNVIDATVDAHFFTFDVSDNLSLNFEPQPTCHLRRSFSPGLKMCFNF